MHGLLLQVQDLSHPEAMLRGAQDHRMFGRLATTLDARQYQAVTSWILGLMQPDMQQRMCAQEALKADFLAVAE